MSHRFESARSKKYPAAERAMRYYLVIERLPEKQRPSQVGTNYPASMSELYGDDDVLAYSHKVESPDKPAKPSPEVIDAALAWVNGKPCNCAWMWQPGRDKRDWEMFCAYAWGVSVQNIADFHNMSRQYASQRLDMIFYQIQVEAEISAMRNGSN